MIQHHNSGDEDYILNRGSFLFSANRLLIHGMNNAVVAIQKTCAITKWGRSLLTMPVSRCTNMELNIVYSDDC